MSFYDLTKDDALRPEDLFKYRLKRDCSIPSRGGQKEFEPDGSWLQSKRLETFLQEKTALLSEPRIEKLKNVVEGSWDNDKKLVDLKKPGKFWMYMGFTDERRNWLYPEEALFLMETNTLELYHLDRPMSIQEAYVKLLGHGVCLEEYQVFAHLRRLGYVVLRHEEEKIFTDYERQINLNDYIDLKKRKESLKKGKGKSSKKISSSWSTSTENHDISKEARDELNSGITSISSPNGLVETTLETKDKDLNNSVNRDDDSSTLSTKRKPEAMIELDNASIKRNKVSSENGDESCEVKDTSFYNIFTWSSCFKNHKQKASEEENHQTMLDSDSHDLFPDVALSATTSLKSPPSQYLPSNVEVTELDIDASMEQLKNAHLNQFSDTKLRREDFKEKKSFSCLGGVDTDSKIKAGSWSEYKRKKSELLAQLSSSTMVDHLWKDTVTPLMHPTEITSYKDVIDRLQIIQSAKSDIVPNDVSTLVTLPKVCFDVHLPDHRFKKSMPGIPDHRVCVTRSDGVPPGLNAIQHFYTKYSDGVPLHWAVVDSGEIAFYIFDNDRTVEALDM